MGSHPPLSRQEIDLLDQFLASELFPEDAFLLDELHGLITAVLCGPRQVEPVQWLPLVCGTEQRPAVEGPDRVNGLILRLHDHLAESLDAGDRFVPMFLEGTLTDGSRELRPQGWCWGFLQGMRFQPDMWEDEALNLELMPILVLSGSAGGEPDVDKILDDERAVARLIDFIPDAVIQIHQHFHRSAATAEGAAQGDQTLCPCGSGRAYRRCCGRPSRLH